MSADELTPVEEHRLIGQATSGDHSALTTLLRAYSPRLRARLAGKIGAAWRSALDEDDVLQVTFLEAFLRIDRFTPKGHGAFLAWLTQIAENNLRDAIKGLERGKRPDPRRRVQASSEESAAALIELLGAESITPSRIVATTEAKGVLDGAVRRLPADYRKVVQDLDLGGRSAAEVAADMNRSPGAVYMLRARAHDQLRELMGPGSLYFSTPG